jgi:hypothetical protein
MNLSFSINGIELSRSDFGDEHRDWVAFSIAFAMNTRCRDKEAFLELLLGTADGILDRTRQHQHVDDLATLVARLVRVVRRHDGGNTVATQAMDFLHRHGLHGSVLRSEE